jgi:hypothetical protein
MIIRIGALLLFLASVSGGTAMELSHPSTKTLWRPFHFDGSGFRPGTAGGAATVLMRDGYLPLIQVNGESPREERLPEGTGAMAGFCYLQAAGGKLQERSGSIPLAGLAVTLHGGAGQVAATTGAGGFFVIALPPGDYKVQAAGFTGKVTVEKGKTSLVAIRGGKRLVD